MVSVCYQDAVSHPNDGVDEAIYKYFKDIRKSVGMEQYAQSMTTFT